MKHVPGIFILLVVFSGCRVYHGFPREYRPTNTFAHQYELEIHLSNLKNSVFDADTFYVSKFMITQEMSTLKSDDSIPQLDIKPERFYEMVDVIKNNYENNPHNYCQQLTILEYEETSSLPLKLLTAFTMGIPCLVGMPANWTSTKVKIQHACYDESGNLISSAWAEGYNKTFVAMYWGFGADARTRSNKLAMEEALINIQH